MYRYQTAAARCARWQLANWCRRTETRAARPIMGAFPTGVPVDWGLSQRPARVDSVLSYTIARLWLVIIKIGWFLQRLLRTVPSLYSRCPSSSSGRCWRWSGGRSCVRSAVVLTAVISCDETWHARTCLVTWHNRKLNDQSTPKSQAWWSNRVGASNHLMTTW